jgi:hypothetical protein
MVMHLGNGGGSRSGRACWAAGQIGESTHTPGQRVSAKDRPAENPRRTRGEPAEKGVEYGLRTPSQSSAGGAHSSTRLTEFGPSGGAAGEPQVVTIGIGDPEVGQAPVPLLEVLGGLDALLDDPVPCGVHVVNFDDYLGHRRV